jgi:hypothetical protein
MSRLGVDVVPNKQIRFHEHWPEFLRRSLLSNSGHESPTFLYGHRLQGLSDEFPPG